MLALYPSNRLEHLSFLLATLLEQQPGRVFESQTILVESPGMQHWLNMSLASQRGIAMNLSFPLPVRFMWDTARAVLGQDSVPAQSPYRREVLIWRIDQLLQGDQFLSDDSPQAVQRYWQSRASDSEQALQRLQLAGALADVFEQYLLYRPEWLLAWEAGRKADIVDPMADWQASLWQELTKQNPMHPARLHQNMLNALKSKATVHGLPSRIIVFALNTMAPQLVSFLDALSAHCDIHLFHLNPSVNYWGDAKSDKERARQLRREGVERWMNEAQGNPFLGNLGKQGRDLFNLLTALDSFEVSAFDVPPPAEERRPDSLLQAVQNDIFHASSPMAYSPVEDDNSVEVVSAHNGLREVQALHDNLLTWLSEDARRRPSDIVVMCPAIEHYAPLIDAVFHRVGTPAIVTNDPPRLPCSVADRAPLDAEPVIAAFMSLLSLPDNRFGVADIIDYLRLDAMQKRFSLSSEDVELMTYYLQQAHIHWGLNKQHKENISGVTASEHFSWWWGLRRLLLGMACEDTARIVRDVLTVPDVEGQSAVVLGKLIQIIDVLSEQAKSLAAPRSPQSWHQTLLALRDSCFAMDDEHADVWESLSRATAMIDEYCSEAGYTLPLTLGQVRDVLTRRFSSPDAGNHFMTGQVTFCSMLPMRSIPFKKVCILGLNDTEFPRQSVPVSIDLMAKDKRRQGDRSRRLEDRYLFLEAIISARESLYLSYQGNSDRDNSPRQPSLVLRELLQTLKSGYGISTEQIVRTLPLHPFSASAFSAGSASYEKGWLRLAQAVQTVSAQTEDELTSAKLTVQMDAVISVDRVARWFEHPLKAYANQCLGVYLENRDAPLENSEPFAESALTRYQVLDALTEAAISDDQVNNVMDRFRLSGVLPETPLTETLLETWHEASQSLVTAVGLHDVTPTDARWQGNHVQLYAQVLDGGDKVVQYHTGSQHARRVMSQYLSQLCLSASGHSIPLDCYYLKWSKGLFALRCATWQPIPKAQANSLLLAIEQLFAMCHESPVPAFASLAQKLFSSSKRAPDEEGTEHRHYERLLEDWLTSSAPEQLPMDQDTYLNWFFPGGLKADLLPLTLLRTIFEPMQDFVKDKKL